jgi:hypothetical protein
MRHDMRTGLFAKIIFAASGVLVLLGCLTSPVLLPYPLFVLAYLLNWRLPGKGRPFMRLVTSTYLCVIILESGAWLSEFLKNSTEPALFHPQLIPDLIMGIGFYAAWWLTWWLVLRRFRFTVSQVFITTGLYGVVIEQQGKIFLMGLQTMPAGLLLWAFIFIAYGSTMALAFWLVRDDFTTGRDHWLKYPLVWLGLVVLSFAVSLVWGLILQLFHFNHTKKFPMREHPLW